MVNKMNIRYKTIKTKPRPQPIITDNIPNLWLHEYPLVTCDKCGYTWTYRGKKKHSVRCEDCYHRISIRPAYSRRLK